MVIFRLLSHFGLSGHFYLIDILLAYFYFHFMCFCAGFNACFLDFDAVLSLFLSVIFFKERKRERKKVQLGESEGVDNLGGIEGEEKHNQNILCKIIFDRK